jgi:hypothetical protein
VYRVVWRPAALTQLSEIWVEAPSSLRARITDTVREIDRELRRDPVAIGESRSERSRIAFVAPLGLLFRVDIANRLAMVEKVWLLRSRHDAT